MKKSNYKVVFGILILLILSYLPGCDKQTNLENGTLEGIILIGPICPVERDPPDPGCLPTAETYKAFPVYIRASNSSKKTLISPALDGSFKIELAPGNYSLTLEKEQNGIGSSNLPMIVSINPLGKTIISIEIDTGIR